MAWDKLYSESEPRPFSIDYAWGAAFLRSQFNCNSPIYKDHPNKTFLLLFDFDTAGVNNWRQLNQKNADTQNTKAQGMYKQIHKNAYAFLLPVPKDLSTYVIEDAPKECAVTIELLFLELLNKQDQDKYFEQKPTRGGGAISQIKASQKTKFAKKCIPSLQSKAFDNFKPLFEGIKNVIANGSG